MLLRFTQHLQKTNKLSLKNRRREFLSQKSAWRCFRTQKLHLKFLLHLTFLINLKLMMDWDTVVLWLNTTSIVSAVTKPFASWLTINLDLFPQRAYICRCGAVLLALCLLAGKNFASNCSLLVTTGSASSKPSMMLAGLGALEHTAQHAAAVATKNTLE